MLAAKKGRRRKRNRVYSFVYKIALNNNMCVCVFTIVICCGEKTKRKISDTILIAI